MEISVTELRRKFGGCLERVRRGETIVVTKDGEPVARLEPCSADRNAALESLVGLIPDVGLAEGEIRALRLAGK